MSSSSRRRGIQTHSSRRNIFRLVHYTTYKFVVVFKNKILLTIVQKLEQFLSSTSAKVGIFRSKIILEVYTRSHFIDQSLTLFYFVQISVVIPDPFPRIRQK